MKNKKDFNEYEVSNNYEKYSGMSFEASGQKKFSRSYDNGKGISVSLQYGKRTNFREYDLQTHAQPKFAEYEVVSSQTNNKSFNKAASVQKLY